MKTRKTNPFVTFFMQSTALIFAVVNLPSAHADPILWSGPATNFVQAAYNPLGTAPPEADVIVPGVVSLTRAGNHWLYNTNVDLAGAQFGTPSDTEWAFGPADSVHTVTNYTYQSFDSFRNFNLSGVLTPNKPMVCHLINEEIYFAVTFTAWPHGGGPFAYTRSTPGSVAPPPPPTPTVNITTPTNNAVFSAPANISITADAAVSTGSVTNVQFFTNAISAGSKSSGPFTITANSLGAAPYTLTAVATAAGISGTSAPVNINVVAPVNTAVSGAAATVDNKFTFSFSSTPGLRYEVDVSSNLFNWTPVSTNVATGNPSFFTNPISGDGNYYRVGRLPNP
jgi:hypothetical protein